MKNKVVELFGQPAVSRSSADWAGIVERCACPYLQRTCLKNRKSSPGTLIGTCAVAYGKSESPVAICPHRFLERRQIFTDCLHLLSLHEPGNELHVVPEVAIPGGSVDYFVASARNRKIRDFVGLEIQAIDTTGTVWPERQRFLNSIGLRVAARDVKSKRPFGMNWKMTAKTTLVQLHHKVETFEHLSKKLVLAMQNQLLHYMQTEFAFSHMAEPPRNGDAMHFHSYNLVSGKDEGLRLELSKRLSTDAAGVAKATGLQTNPRIDLETILAQLEAKISTSTLFRFRPNFRRKPKD